MTDLIILLVILAVLTVVFFIGCFAIGGEPDG